MSQRYLVAVLSAALLVVGSSSLFAQGGRPPFGGGFGGPGGDTGAVFFLIQDENVRKDLELVEDQVTKIREIGRKMFEGGREQFQGLRDLSEEEREKKMTEIRENMQKRATELQAEVNNVLLPHQRERLKQISLQSRLRRGNTSDAIASDTIAKELGITDEQKEKLKAAQEEAQKEMQEKLTKLQEELKAKVLKVLTAEQRAKFEKMVGEKIEFSSTGFGGRGGPGGPGGRGGPGGARPAPEGN
jgi:Spy/CpxP family protein refolding chaperone